MKFCGIEIDPECYDDDAALAAYAVIHYQHLMTALDRRVVDYIAPILSSSNDFKLSRLYAHLEERDGHVPDEDVIAAFAKPIEQRRLEAGRRVLAARRDEMVIARCPECSKLLRTPLAKQCLWCGHDWHNGG